MNKVRELGPLKVTELIIYYHRHGFPKRKWTVAGRLFQARMWREHAKHWHRDPWIQQVLRISRDECLRRVRVNIYLARRINRALIPQEHGEKGK